MIAMLLFLWIRVIAFRSKTDKALWDFWQLDLNLAHSFQFLGAVVAEAVDESIAEYDYDNANDVDEFCPDLPNNPDVGNYDEGEGEGGYFPSQSILPTQTQGKCISFGINVLKIQAFGIVFDRDFTSGS